MEFLVENINASGEPVGIDVDYINRILKKRFSDPSSGGKNPSTCNTGRIDTYLFKKTIGTLGAVIEGETESDKRTTPCNNI